jgi:hypothetical protein
MTEGASLRAGGPGPTLATRVSTPAIADEALPLSGLSAFAALCAMTVNQLVLPAMGVGANRTAFVRLERAGQFAANLAVIAGFIAMIFGVVSVVRGEPRLSKRRKILGLLFGALLMRAVVVATLFDRTATTTENVYLAVGAANLLAVLIGMTAIERVRGRFLRAVSLLVTAVPLFAMLTVILELSGDVALDPWKQKAHVALAASGELTYLGLLLASFPLLVPRALRGRDLVARSVGLVVLIATLYGMRAAYGALPADYNVLLYNAQRIGLLLDRWPLAYTFPLCLALSAVATALVSGHAARTQAALGILLYFASGYAPRAPGRLLTMTLGAFLLSRALIALDKQRRER